jgi:predicted branched-subunit amino acid permease
MVDQAYASSILQFERAPALTTAEKVAYYFGIGDAGGCRPGSWIAGLGAVLGAAIPKQMPMAFAVPIAFLALVGPMLRTTAQASAALVSVAGALVLSGLPYNLGLLLAALVAMAPAPLIERRGWNGRARR